MPKPESVAIGDGHCPFCNSPIVIRSSKSGYLTYTCASVADGGCQHQHFSRSDRHDELLARKVIAKWRKSEYRAEYLSGGPSPEPEPEPAPKSKPKPAPAPDPEPAPALPVDETEKELFG